MMAQRENDSVDGSCRIWGCSSDLAPSDLARYRRAYYLAFLWLAVLAAVAVGLSRWAPEPGVLAYAVAALPVLLFAAFAVAYGTFLRKADELTRKIQLEGMGVGFGVALLVILGYPVFELVGAPGFNAAYAVVAMTLAALFTIHRQQRRYT